MWLVSENEVYGRHSVETVLLKVKDVGGNLIRMKVTKVSTDPALKHLVRKAIDKLIEEMHRDLLEKGFVSLGANAQLTPKGVIPIQKGKPEPGALLTFDRLTIRNSSVGLMLFRDDNAKVPALVISMDEPNFVAAIEVFERLRGASSARKA